MATAEIQLPVERSGQCGQCLDRLREQLAAQPGVAGVGIGAARGQLAVDFDPAVLPFERLQSVAGELDAALARRYAHESISVGGLDCADCAATLEAGLAGTPGVESAKVNFAAGTLAVEYDRERVSRQRLLSQIGQLGYATTDAVAGGQLASTFLLSGLDCADCAVSVERNLATVPGIISARVNFASATLDVRHAASVQAHDIASVVEASGYGAAPVRQGEAAGQVPFWARNGRALLTVVAGAFWVLGLAVSWLDWPNPAAGERLGQALFALVIAGGGYHVARAGVYGLVKSRSLDMNVLMTVAVLGALAIGQWEEAATVVFLFALGNSLEGYTMDRARGAIRSLISLAPNTAHLSRAGREVTVPVEQVQVGEVVQVRPGEKMPVDGRVVAGASSVNEAPVTGESLPVEKAIGDQVYAGTFNERGYLEVEATRPYAENTISRITHLVEEAQAERAGAQRFVDEFSRYYTPAVLVGALAVVLIPWLFFGRSFEVWFYRALVLLVIACPCALVISTPVAIVSAIARAARLGVLIKGGARLEDAARVRVMAFDKTGTLTVGRPEVTDVVALDGLDEGELLRLAARLEERSEHPLAAAILRRANGQTGNHKHDHSAGEPDLSDFVALPGRGVRARVDGRTYYLGNGRLFADLGVPLDGVAAEVEALHAQGKTVLTLGDERGPLGYIAVADRLRPGAREALQALRQVGVGRIVLLTGDQESTARAITQAAGADEYFAGLLPDDKAKVVRQLRAKYGGVGMVGDGVNDAPALAAADVGIAMGAAGSDVALETADIALMADDLDKVAFAVGLARRALSTIRWNVAFALALKALFLGLAAFGVATLWLAILADTGASLLVTLNGMRLLGYGRRFARPDQAHRQAHAATEECHDEGCACGQEHENHEEDESRGCGHDHAGHEHAHAHH